MSKMKVNGTVVAVAVGVVALWYLKNKAVAVANAVNPVNPNNVVNQGVTAVVGEQNLATAGDYVFGWFDLLNPFNESDEYAEKVYGIDKVKSWFGFGDKTKSPTTTGDTRAGYMNDDYATWVKNQHESISD